MLLSQQSHIQCQRSTRSGPIEEVEDVDAAEEVEAEEVSLEEVKLLQVETSLLNIQIFRLASGQGATCTENLAVVLTFVLNQGLALGKTSSLPSLQNNERLTSPATLIRL